MNNKEMAHKLDVCVPLQSPHLNSGITARPGTITPKGTWTAMASVKRVVQEQEIIVVGLLYNCWSASILSLVSSSKSRIFTALMLT